MFDSMLPVRLAIDRNYNLSFGFLFSKKFECIYDDFGKYFGSALDEYRSKLDDLVVVGKLRLSAFQQHSYVFEIESVVM